MRNDKPSTENLKVISGISGIVALLAVFVLTFASSMIFQDSLLPQSGYFSELANALTFPIRFGFSFILAYIFYLFATAYDIRIKFIPVLVVTLFVFLGIVASVVESDLGDTYRILVRQKPHVEQAIIVGLITSMVFVSAKVLLEVVHYLSHKTTVRLSLTFYLLVLVIVSFWSGSAYMATHRLDQLVRDEQAIQLPNTDDISTKVPAELEAVRQLKQKNATTKVIYTNEPLIDGQKQQDHLTISIVGFGTKLEEHCGATNPRSTTSNGIQYTYEVTTRNSSIPPLPENSYEQTKLCFVVGQYGFNLSRDNAYGKTGYAKYSHDKIISSFKE